MAGDRKFYMAKGSTYIETQNNYIRGNQIIGDTKSGASDDESVESDTQADLSPLQRELMPIFFNDADVVVRFTKEVNGASNPAVAEIINRYIAQEKILKSERKKPLWEILSKYNVYTVGYDNFKARVN